MRAGAALPANVSASQSPQSDKHMSVFVICRRGGRGDIADVLISALSAAPGITITEDPTLLQAADKVLVLLTEGVLRDQRLTQLIDVLECDGAAQRDRLVFVCQTESEGWVFGNRNPDISAAPKCVQNALNEHEAISYRSKKYQHEFVAMINHLVGKLLEKGRHRF